MKIVKLELVSRPDEIYLGRIYSKESYDKVKEDFINKNWKFILTDLNRIIKIDSYMYSIKETNIIGRIMKWEDYYIEVNIKDEYYDKYDWENCKAGIYYISFPIKDNENPEIIKSDIYKIIAFHILTPLDLKAINRENNKYK